jgi:predicted O-methyltransferase YrrM
MILPPPTSYQKHLADFVREHKLRNIVETGLGVSTLYLLDALDSMGAGHLTSIDPSPWYAGELPKGRENWTWMQMNSQTAFLTLARLNPQPIDLFLHDSDHDCRSQTFEYLFMWGMVRKGGWIASDDATWGGHGAWQKFCKWIEQTPTKLDALEMVQKTDDPMFAELLHHWDWCMAKAKVAEADWLAAGGTNSDAFKEYRKGYV